MGNTWLIFSDDASNFLDSNNKPLANLPKASRDIILTAEFSSTQIQTLWTAGYGVAMAAAPNNALNNGSFKQQLGSGSNVWQPPASAYSGNSSKAIALAILGNGANPGPQPNTPSFPNQDPSGAVGTLIYPSEATGFTSDIVLAPDFEYDVKPTESGIDQNGNPIYINPNPTGADKLYGYLQTLISIWALRTLNPSNPLVPVLGQNIASGASGFSSKALQEAAQKILPLNVLNDFNFNATTFPELLFSSHVTLDGGKILPLVDSLSVENYGQNQGKTTASAPNGFPVTKVPYSVMTDFSADGYKTSLPTTSNYGPASNQTSANLPEGSIYIGAAGFDWSSLTDSTLSRINLQPVATLKSSSQNLQPETWLMHYGLPNGFIATEQQFEKLCNDLIEFISNSGIKKVYFEIGDYISNKQYNYCDPSNPASGTTSPWIVKYLLNKLPSQVEVGAVVTMTPQYPWKIDKNNTANNLKIGDGSSAVQPKDNARQAFELIQTINNLSPNKQFTSFHFDHEGGGDYQNDTNYGGNNGQAIGAGYLKWLWNHFMPSNAGTFSDSQAASPSFTGHYNFGWINYRTTAWLNKSSGSIDAYSENYWFGENEDYPGQYALDPSLTPILNKAERLGLDLKSFIDVFGTDPSKYPASIAGGANLINWSRTVDPKTGQPSSSPDAVPILNENAIYTVYRMYKDNPEALAQIFNNKNYSFISSGGVPAFSDVYYAPIDITQANNNLNSPQGGIPTVSFENLSSSNQSQQAVIDAGLANRSPSLTSQFTVANDKLNPNTTGGSFDGLSALSYDNFITFLNTSASILAGAGITPGQPTRDPSTTRIALYELQFIPLDWISQQVANHHPYLLRLHDPVTGQHHLTHNIDEANNLGALGWIREGRAISLLTSNPNTPGTLDVSRLFNPGSGDHLLTTASGEIQAAQQFGYILEGTIGAVSANGGNGLRPIYRFLNNMTHEHFYTNDSLEAQGLGPAFQAEGLLGFS